MEPTVKITVVIPTKNEAAGIQGVVAGARAHTDDVIVVDGRSTDGTAELAREAGAEVFRDDGKGKGCGIRLGIEKAGGDILVFIDADGSHRPEDIPLLAQPIIDGKADMVVASRIMGGSEDLSFDFDGLIRQIGNLFATFLINWRHKSRLSDIQNGFRAIRKDVAQELNLSSNDFEIEEEMVIRCLKKKYRVLEVPSHEYARKWGVSKLPTRKGWGMFYKLIVELFF